MSAIPETAMVLAAGLGTRMRPLTDDRPKAMIEVAGITLIDRSLDRLAAVGVKRAVVNLHHFGSQLTDHLQHRTQPQILFSDEAEQLMDTGGGVVKALPLLGPDPFWVANCDVVLRDTIEDGFASFARIWDDQKMDALLLMQPTVTAIGYNGFGDFNMAPDGSLTRRPEREVSPFLFAGIQIVHPRFFLDPPEGPFSMNLLWDRAFEEGRLYGARHAGQWMDVGTPDGLAAAEAALATA